MEYRYGIPLASVKVFIFSRTSTTAMLTIEENGKPLQESMNQSVLTHISIFY